MKLKDGCKNIKEDQTLIKHSIRKDASIMREDLLLSCAEPLLKWYQKEHRDLPWRKNKDPYCIWVSEIMLQQTRVEAVKPYYKRFMEAFPTVKELACADEELLLKYWEGLGYYSRVRNMKKAAVMVQEEFNGQMPSTYQELLKLPGIGTYTAGAIASIAFGEAVAAVDGNVFRVLSRLRADGRNISLPETRKSLELELRTTMPKEHPGDFNQALMELGATVCLPTAVPQCTICPWEKICLAHQRNCEQEFPVKDKKKARIIEKYTVLVLKQGDYLALKKRPEKGLLAGMYELPMLEGHLTEKEVLEKLKTLGLAAIRIKVLELSKHVFTHKEWHMIGYVVYLDELEQRKNSLSEEVLFVLPEETKEAYPIPTAFRAYTKYINLKLGNELFQQEKFGVEE